MTEDIQREITKADAEVKETLRVIESKGPLDYADKKSLYRRLEFYKEKRRSLVEEAQALKGKENAKS